MIVLDTNLLSELLRPSPDERVWAWLARQPRLELFTTVITQAEMLEGALRLPAGKRRAQLVEAIARLMLRELAGQILPFDQDAAVSFAALMARRRLLGKPMATADAYIAAICQTRGAALATRNVKDFTDCGLALIDPWRA